MSTGLIITIVAGVIGATPFFLFSLFMDKKNGTETTKFSQFTNIFWSLFFGTVMAFLAASVTYNFDVSPRCVDEEYEVEEVVESYSLASLASVGLSVESVTETDVEKGGLIIGLFDGSSHTTTKNSTNSGFGDGEYLAVKITAEGGLQKVSIPENKSTIYPVDDASQARVEVVKIKTIYVVHDGFWGPREYADSEKDQVNKIYVPADGIAPAGWDIDFSK
ncbi:MAG: hypothetical protein RR547_01140 [Raoultibacter sp.]